MSNIGIPQRRSITFFYTLAFWVAISSLQGSLMYIFTSADSVFDMEHAYGEERLAWVDWMVTLLFLLSAYFAYVRLINCPPDAERCYVWPTSWGEVINKSDIESFCGTLSLFIAMLLWTVPSTISITAWKPSGAVLIILKKLPNMLGGVGFFLAGVCECVHLRHVAVEQRLAGQSPTKLFLMPVCWVALMDLVGGLNFMVGGMCSLVGYAPTFAAGNLFMGSICYTLGSLLLVVMWRGNDFGFALMYQFNSVAEFREDQFGIEHGGERAAIHLQGDLLQHANRTVVRQTRLLARTHRSELSFRATTFLVVYCWLFVMIYINFVTSTAHKQSTLRHAGDLIMNLLWLFLLVVVLVVHSALHSVPNVQPYRFAMFSMRVILSCMAGVQTVLFGDTISHLAHFTPGSKHVN